MSEKPDPRPFIAMAAEEIRDGDICFIGIGVPSLAAMLAKRHHARDAVLIYESGAIDADPPVAPLSTGSPSVVQNTAMLASCLGVFGMLQKGVFDRGYLSAAQIDRLGNLNSTVLMHPKRPPMHLVGSGGAHDIAVLAKETVIMMPHDPRRFVERVDFITSPGIGNATEGRSSRGNGPVAVVTPSGRFTFEAGELTLEAVAHGFEESDVVEGLGWEVPRAGNVRRLAPIDPSRLATAGELLAAWGRDAA